MKVRRRREWIVLALILSIILAVVISNVYSKYLTPILIQRDLLGQWLSPTFEIPRRDSQGWDKMWETVWTYDLDEQGEAFLGSRYGCSHGRSGALVCTRCRFVRGGTCILEQRAAPNGLYRTLSVTGGKFEVAEGLAPTR